MRYIRALMVVLTLLACRSLDQNERLDHYLNHTLGIPVEKQPKVVVCIAERGCPVCSRAFADMARPFISDPDVLVIVQATGSSIDLTGLLHETANIRHDDTRAFRALGLLEGSGLVVLKQGRIDTIVPVRTAGFEQQLEYMQSVLVRSTKESAARTL